MLQKPVVKNIIILDHYDRCFHIFSFLKQQQKQPINL